MEASPTGVATASGTFAKTPAVHLLVYMQERNLTGSLLLDAAGSRATISFRDGAPSRARVDPTEHLIGRVFEDLGYLGQEEVRTALADAEKSKRLVGSVLLERSLVSAEQLRMGLAVQLHRRMGRVFSYDDATKFSYYDRVDLLSGYGDPTQPVADPLTLVWMGLRKRPLRVHLEASLTRLSGMPMRFAEEATIERFGFGPQELEIIERVKQRTFTVADFTGQEERLVLYGLIITKQVAIEGVHRPQGSASVANQKAVRSAADGLRSPSSVSSGSHKAAAPTRHSSGSMAAQQAPGPVIRSSRPNMAAVVAAQHPSRPVLSPEHEQLRKEIVGRAASIEKLDYFEMLGVDKTVDNVTLQSAFVSLAKRWHPDRLPKELEHVKAECSKVFTQLTQAHATLGDRQKREEYTALLREGTATPEAQRQLQVIVDAVKFFQKAEVFLKLRDYVQAEQFGLKAMELDPQQADYITLVGWVQGLKPENQSPEGTKRSIELLSQAIKIQPQHEKAFYYRGMLFKRLDDAASAFRDFKKAASINPNNVDAVREVRLYYMRGGRSSPPSNAPHMRPGTSPPPVDKGGFFGRLFKK